MTELELRIQSAAQSYYGGQTTELTDEEFDTLVAELKETQPDSILFKVGWGYDVSKVPGMKRPHLYTTIGSLEKCHNLNELKSNGFPSLIFHSVHASTKLDGMSVVLYYDDGLLSYALTRGDGETGIDITDKVFKIAPYLASTTKSFTGAIRGEIVMSYTQFDKFKQEHPEAKNPRNSTAGLINGKNTFEDLEYLDIVLYTLVHDSKYKDRFKYSISETLKDIQELLPSCKIVPNEVVLLNKSDEASFIERMNNLKSTLYQDIPADGIVLSIASIYNEYGTFRYDAKAFKFPSESQISKIIDIEWNMSKNRIAVPRILIDPIQLSGSTVQACSGYNAKYILDNDLGIGSIVEISKAGEIIPNIVKILKSTISIIPTYCPECGGDLIWEGVNLVCPNVNCSNAIKQDTLTWLQNIVPTDNLGDTLKLKYLYQLVDNDIIDNISIESIMQSNIKLEETTSSIQFNNFATMWNKLHDDSNTIELINALLACNIPRIGDLTAVKFAAYADMIQIWIDNNIDKNKEQECVEKFKQWIGEANTQSICVNINKLRRLNLIKHKINWKSISESKIKGKVAITGKLSMKRAEFEKLLKQHGYELSELSKDCMFLITNDPNSSSSKNKKAVQLGIEKISEVDFIENYLK